MDPLCLVCLVCGVPLSTRRRDTRTCGPTCRQRLRRHPSIVSVTSAPNKYAKCDTVPYGRIVQADALAYLQTLPAGCVDLCLTSPPYWAKRTYSTDPRELGQERAPAVYLAALVAICAEVRRVLRPSGWFLLNVADTYANQPGRGRGSAKRAISAAAQRATASAPDKRLLDHPLKSLTFIPWRLADTLTAHGWRARNVISWHKLGHQPEHVNDRLTQAWEPIFALTPAATSFYAHPRDRGTANENDHWSIPVGRGTRGAGGGHPAVFPDVLVERAITRFCPPGGVVLDCFAGSGTVRDVAQRMGRLSLGCDLVDWGEASA